MLYLYSISEVRPDCPIHDPGFGLFELVQKGDFHALVFTAAALIDDVGEVGVHASVWIEVGYPWQQLKVVAERDFPVETFWGCIFQVFLCDLRKGEQGLEQAPLVVWMCWFHETILAIFLAKCNIFC